MGEITHDPSEYIRGIYQILINSKKRIGFLFGAGTSLACKACGRSLTIPAIAELTNEIVSELKKEKDENGKELYTELLDTLKEDFANSFNIETLLTNLEQKYGIIGKEKLGGFNKDEYYDLIMKIKKEIKKRVSVHLTKNIDYETLVQADFAQWVGQADRAFGIEIFTTNYDFLFELGLEYNSIPYYDGFTGSYKPFFADETVEKLSYLPFQTKLWKIHGSIGWYFDEQNRKIIRGNSEIDDIIIYPTSIKYLESKKLPYISLLDRLSNFLLEDDTVLFTCGYSFNDMHINQRILSALNADKNSHVIALYWDQSKDEHNQQTTYGLNCDSHMYKLAKSNGKLTVLGFKSAIIGRQLGKWKLTKEPDANDTPNVNLYFDEDAAYFPEAEVKKEFKGNEKWTGEGKFILPDFVHFVNFLNSMIQENSLFRTKKNGNG